MLHSHGLARMFIPAYCFALPWQEAAAKHAEAKRLVSEDRRLVAERQRLAAENDARAHTTQAARNVFKQIQSEGLRAALHDRDAPFGDGKVRVRGPEIRDASGNLVDEPLQ